MRYVDMFSKTTSDPTIQIQDSQQEFQEYFMQTINKIVHKSNISYQMMSKIDLATRPRSKQNFIIKD